MSVDRGCFERREICPKLSCSRSGVIPVTVVTYLNIKQLTPCLSSFHGVELQAINHPENVLLQRQINCGLHENSNIDNRKLHSSYQCPCESVETGRAKHVNIRNVHSDTRPRWNRTASGGECATHRRCRSRTQMQFVTQTGECNLGTTQQHRRHIGNILCDELEYTETHNDKTCRERCPNAS